MVRGETRKAWSVVVLSAALAAGLLATLLWATAPAAEAAGRYKVVTRTLTNAQPIAIPEFGAAAPYASEIAAGGFRRGKVLDVNVTLKGFSHAVSEDADVMLSHRGSNPIVMSDAGGSSSANGVTLKLDDEATRDLPEVYALATGAFRPTNHLGPFPRNDAFPDPAPAAGESVKLSGFDGMSPNGPWQLWVMDDFAGESGQVAGGWSVTIKARVLR